MQNSVNRETLSTVSVQILFIYILLWKRVGQHILYQPRNQYRAKSSTQNEMQTANLWNQLLRTTNATSNDLKQEWNVHIVFHFFGKQGFEDHDDLHHDVQQCTLLQSSPQGQLQEKGPSCWWVWQRYHRCRPMHLFCDKVPKRAQCPHIFGMDWLASQQSTMRPAHMHGYNIIWTHSCL